MSSSGLRTQIFQFMTNDNKQQKLSNSTNTAIDYSTCYAQSFLDVLSKEVVLKRCINNHKVYISNECPFCGYEGIRVFRYNLKLKVGKSFCCGKSFKDLSQLKEELRYLEWHKDKLGTNYRRFGKSEIVDDNLPF